MKIERLTLSYCPTCYRELQATIKISNDSVLMEKTCPVHGDSVAILEKDPVFYLHAKALKASEIYPGHFVDVTRTCNLRCNPCFYPLEKSDPKNLFAVAEILNECEVNMHRQRFHFTGGEPTLHPNLGELIVKAQRMTSIGKRGVEIVTNGVKFSDPEFYNEIVPLVTGEDGVCCLNLSIHHKETDKWNDLISRARMDGIKLQSALIVCHDEESFLEAITIAESVKDCVLQFRIKGASKMWNDFRPSSSVSTSKVFVSDMLQWLEKSGGYFPIMNQCNKPMFFNVIHKKMHLSLVCWHDVHNVDLAEIETPPTYRARNGEVCNLVTANLINEGMRLGWLKGVRYEDIQSQPK